MADIAYDTVVGTFEQLPKDRRRDADATARFAALIRPFLLRRRKTDPGIAPELPRKTESDVFVPLTAEQVTLYEAMVRETMEAISRSEGIERAGLVFKLLTALKQICNHPAQYLKQPAPLEGRSGKLAAFDELTDIILAGGESMLVFTQYTQMGALLQQHLDARGIGSLFLHGGVPVPGTAIGDTLLVATSNGVDEAHKGVVHPDAASFVAMNKTTGAVLWTDKSPGKNIMHGQWSSPACGVLGGVEQAIFAGLLHKAGDGLRLSEHLEGHGALMFRRACAMGLEGVVSKRRDSAYKSGRSPHWVKVKNPDAPAVCRIAEIEW